MKRPSADDINLALLIALILTVFAMALGCKTACIPKVDTQEKLVPEPCVIQIGVLEPPPLPPYPPFDPSDPKEWALQVEQVAKQREALLIDYTDRLEKQITGHNRLEPRCAQ